jgi:transposase
MLAHRYDDEGPHGLVDHRHDNPGGTSLLSAQQQAQLQQALDESPDDGVLWTGPKVAHWIETHTGRQVHPQRGWEYLKRLNGSLRLLRPRHAKADPAAHLGPPWLSSHRHRATPLKVGSTCMLSIIWNAFLPPYSPNCNPVNGYGP